MELNTLRCLYSYRSIEVLFASLICAKNKITFEKAREAYGIQISTGNARNLWRRDFINRSTMTTFSNYTYKYFKSIIGSDDDIRYFEAGLRFLFRFAFFLKFTRYQDHHEYRCKNHLPSIDPVALPLSYPLLLEDTFFDQNFEDDKQLEKWASERLHRADLPIGDGVQRINTMAIIKAIYYNKEDLICDAKSFINTYIDICESDISQDNFIKLINHIEDANIVASSQISSINAIEAKIRYNENLRKSREQNAKAAQARQERLAKMPAEDIEAKKKEKREEALRRKERSRIERLFKDVYPCKGLWRGNFFEVALEQSFYLLYVQRKTNASDKDIAAFLNLSGASITEDMVKNFIEYAKSKESLLYDRNKSVALYNLLNDGIDNGFEAESDAAFLFDFPLLYAMHIRRITYSNLIDMPAKCLKTLVKSISQSETHYNGIIEAIKGCRHYELESIVSITKRTCISILKTGRCH